MNSKLKKLLVMMALAFTSSTLIAAELPPERGWFYFDDPVEVEVEEFEVAQPTPKPQTEEQKEEEKDEKCSSKETWTADCGFIHPGTDFEFQALQRDQLMETMIMSNNDPKAVEAFQFYMHWVLERTSEVANLWWYNMVQNPDLDPTAAQPVSALGLKLMTEVQKGSEREVFELVKKEGGMFVYFSRSDCAFCHHMKDPLRMLERRTGVKVRNAAIDGVCMPGYEEGCVDSELAVQAAEALQVTTVPSIFLYVKPDTWIRIATGVTDTESMATRAMQFFSAYRNALIKGVQNTEKGVPSVDFGGDEITGNKNTGLGGQENRGNVSEAMVSDLLRN